MADIIAESGLSAGAIYGYFSSKKELIREVAASLLAGRRGELIAADMERVLSPAEIVAMIATGFGREAPLAALIQAWGEATVDHEIRDSLLEGLETMRVVIVHALTRWAATQPDGSPAATAPEAWAERSAPVLISILPGFALQSSLVPGFDSAQFLDALSGVLLSAPTAPARSAQALTHSAQVLTEV